MWWGWVKVVGFCFICVFFSFVFRDVKYDEMVIIKFVVW